MFQFRPALAETEVESYRLCIACDRCGVRSALSYQHYVPDAESQVNAIAFEKARLMASHDGFIATTTHPIQDLCPRCQVDQLSSESMTIVASCRQRLSVAVCRHVSIAVAPSAQIRVGVRVQSLPDRRNPLYLPGSSPL